MLTLLRSSALALAAFGVALAGEPIGLDRLLELLQAGIVRLEIFDVAGRLVRTLRNDVMESAGPGSPVGRRLEFLLQELSREANTIGSKGSDAPIAHLIVDLKTELERMREQVQNIE